MVSPAHPRARSSRRDEQSRETRRRLVDATIDLVSEVGWRRTTIEQIAERAGVAKGTFFVHFRTKEAIALTLAQLQLGAAVDARDAVVAHGGTPVERLEAAVMALGMHAAANLELSRAVLVASLESREVGGTVDAIFAPLHRAMTDDAGEALRAGLLEGTDADTVASLLRASYLGAALHCASTPNARPLGDVLRPLVATTLDALTPKAHAAPEPSLPPIVKKASARRRAKARA